MAELITMPKLGFDMAEGTLVKWLKQPGDTVARGEIIAEIETDKATVEVEAFTEGTMLELLANEGDILPIGVPIAVIGAAGEEYDLAALGVGEAASEGQPVAPPEAQTASVLNAPPVPAASPVATPASPASNGHGLPDGVRASPLARRIAQDKGIDITRVNGSGPGGRIVKKDVESFTPGAAQSAPAYTPFAVPTGPDSAEEPTPRIRKLIAQRMTQSKQTVPHFYVTTEIDMAAALALRKQINEPLPKERQVSVNDMIVKATALALRAFPNLNSAFNGDTIVRNNRVNVGIAVALDVGLMNVVSKDADVTPLTIMAPRHKEMIDRAREGKVKPDDVDGATFAVSNLGAFDVDHFIAIINPPDAGILAVGSAKQVPIVTEDGELGIGTRMKATVSADHRVTDGAEAARFMQEVKAILEEPLRLMM